MSMDLPPDFLATFCDEAQDTLAQWERVCLELERSPTPESCNALFRFAHNIKGSARSVGLDALGMFVHKVEDVITLLKNGEILPTSDLLSVFLSAQELLLEWVEKIRSDPLYVSQTESVLNRLKHFVPSSSVPSVSASPPPEPPAFQFFEDGPGVPPEVILEQKQALEAVPAPQTAEPVPAQPVALPAREAPANAAAPTARSTGKAEETIRVSAQKLDALIQSIGELSIQQSIIQHARTHGGLNSLASLNAIYLANKIVKDVQGTALSLRMQPLASLFQRLERVARDIAREQGKPVQVRVEGEGVELDKTIIERITDPLTHILRNAVDHGIEKPPERVGTGKNPIASIFLAASPDVSGVLIRISDDGKGLNRSRILAKAIEKGLVKPGARLPESEIQNLIFLPGFSTAEKVTNISGRGVGMDVVKRTVDELGGSLSIQSQEGQGSVFSILLPTTVSIVEALIVISNGERYAIPIQELSEIIDLNMHRIESSTAAAHMIDLRGQVVPLQSLEAWLPLTERRREMPTRRGTKRQRPALLTRAGEGLLAFQVDGILGQQSVVVRPLSPQLSRIPGLSGSTILGDGEPGMIVGLSVLARQWLTQSTLREVS